VWVRVPPPLLKKFLQINTRVFGGGLLFRSLLEGGLVDAVEVTVVPVLLGEGIPLLPPKPYFRVVQVEVD
jgi:dihydrofolate reductase